MPAPEGLCGPCRSDLPTLPRERCSLCATPVATGRICGRCLVERPHYDGVSARYAYDFPVDALIQAFKYGGELRLAQFFGHAIAASTECDADLVVPMPLAVARLKERGYNQALELARAASRLRGIPLDIHVCRRVVDTPPQARLPWHRRAGNVRRAFVCDANVSGLRIAVVDDVLTTGATLDALARNLKRAGAAAVYGWVAARAVPRLYRHGGDAFE